MTNKRWLLCEWWISTKAWNIPRVILEVMEMKHEEKDTTYEVRTPQYSETPKCLICSAVPLNCLKFAIFIQSIDSIFIRILPRTLAIPNFCPSSGLGLQKKNFHMLTTFTIYRLKCSWIFKNHPTALSLISTFLNVDSILQKRKFIQTGTRILNFTRIQIGVDSA